MFLAGKECRKVSVKISQARTILIGAINVTKFDSIE